MPDRPSYRHAVRVPEEGRAQVWRFGGRVSTLRSSDAWVKRLDGFDGDAELALACLEAWESRGYSGAPTNPAAFFHEEFNTPRVPWSINGPLGQFFHGGWMELLTDRGHQPGPLGYYDLKGAYRWAGTMEPLPTSFRPYEPGDDRFIWIMDVDRRPAFVPSYFRRRDRVIVTDRDLETYGIRGTPVWGISWDPEESTPRVAETLEELDGELPPRAYKRLTQSYWGRWACLGRVVQETWEGGRRVSEHRLKNPVLNLPWAVMILHRVMRRTWRAALEDAVLVCVDAVMRTSPLPSSQIGEELGDWRLKDQIGPEGVTLEAPGVWTRAPAPEDRGAWDRHAGYRSRPTAERERQERDLAALLEDGYDYRGLLTRSLEGYGAPRVPADAYARALARELEETDDGEAPRPRVPELDPLEEFDTMLRGFF